MTCSLLLLSSHTSARWWGQELMIMTNTGFEYYTFYRTPSEAILLFLVKEIILLKFSLDWSNMERYFNGSKLMSLANSAHAGLRVLDHRPNGLVKCQYDWGLMVMMNVSFVINTRWPNLLLPIYVFLLTTVIIRFRV